MFLKDRCRGKLIISDCFTAYHKIVKSVCVSCRLKPTSPNVSLLSLSWYYRQLRKSRINMIKHVPSLNWIVIIFKEFSWIVTNYHILFLMLFIVSVWGQDEGYTVKYTPNITSLSHWQLVCTLPRECTVKYTPGLKVILTELNLSIPSLTDPV